MRLDEEIHNFYCSRDIIRMIESRRTGYVACIGEMINVCTILVGKPEG
jgi:hypothetical protein